MTLILTRKDKRQDGIFSELTDDSGNFIAVTLEHSYDGEPKLQDGTYNCVKGIHELHNGIPFEAYEVMNVPGHTGILCTHVGNYNADSDGCVLIGMNIKDMDDGSRMITHSMIAFSKFMTMLEKYANYTLVVKS